LAQGKRKKRQRKKTPTYRDVVLSLIAAVLALAGSGQELRTERLRTEGVADIDVHSMVVREQRLNGRGRENRKGRKRKDACLAMACNHGFKFELRLLSRRQDGCALPGKEGP
jgi:hypothetical protein